MHYPSKQTIIIFFVCLVAIAGMAIYVDRKTPKESASTSSQLSVFSQTQEKFVPTQLSTSTEWKNVFLETGTSSDSFKTPVKAATTSPDDALTATDKFSRGLFSQYVSLKQVGLNTDPAIVSSTISSLLAQSDAGADKPREYSVSDIKVSPDTSVAALKQYGNMVGLLLSSNTPVKDDATLALAGLQKKDPAYKEEIAANVLKYKRIIAGLLAIPAPKSAAPYHLNLINGVSQMIFIADALEASEPDPMRAMGGLKMYSTTFPLVMQNILFLRNVIGSASITYTDTEGGSFFKLKPR